MFRIAICDDEKTVCSEIENIIMAYKPQGVDGLDTEVFYSGEELCTFILRGNYFDLIFLDIEMHMLNGVEVGLKLRNEMDNQTTQIVYVSCRESYYKALFEVRPLNFISKPITPPKIIKEIEKALSLTGKMQGLFTYKIGHDAFKVPYKNVLWFESSGRRVKMVLSGGEEIFYGNLDSIESELLPYHFMRIHRAYLINYFHVTRFRYSEVVMSNNTTLPISKSNQKAIRSLQTKWDSERL